MSTWQDPPTDLVQVMQAEVLSSQDTLGASLPSIELLKFEFSTSNIDSNTLSAVCTLCNNMNTHITQLVLQTRRLTPRLRSRFMVVTCANHESLVSDLMVVLSLIQGALISGNPLPAILPTPLLGKAFQKRAAMSREHDLSPQESEGSTIKEILTGDESRLWASSLTSFMSLLGTIDEVVVVLKRAVGEESEVRSGMWEV